MGQVIQIAIDGPSGAGKSTIARRAAEALGIDYIDTGAMYRAFACKMLDRGVSLADREGILAMLPSTDIGFDRGETILDGQVVSHRIRTPEISKLASDVSALPEVREKLVALQREMGRVKSVIMDGRDIGTNVFPKAPFKFFVTAAPEERARRRWKELQDKGQEVSLSEVEKDMAERDKNDSTRAVNPLRKAEDAVELDTTNLSVEEATGIILNAVRETLNPAGSQSR